MKYVRSYEQFIQVPVCLGLGFLFCVIFNLGQFVIGLVFCVFWSAIDCLERLVSEVSYYKLYSLTV